MCLCCRDLILANNLSKFLIIYNFVANEFLGILARPENHLVFKILFCKNELFTCIASLYMN